MSSQHDMVVSPGDEELWVSCTCGWKVPGHHPAPPTKSLDDAFTAWYWAHGIKEQIKLEEGDNK